jgi:dipeptidyl aminopeptidase/acylaminoacyl peptidase
MTCGASYFPLVPRLRSSHRAPARFVSLPHEGHTYVARESVLHVLAEMVDWLDRYVKTAASR